MIVKIGEIEMADNLDHEDMLEMDMHDGCTWLTREDAMKVIDHLQKVFGFQGTLL